MIGIDSSELHECFRQLAEAGVFFSYFAFDRRFIVDWVQDASNEEQRRAGVLLGIRLVKDIEPILNGEVCNCCLQASLSWAEREGLPICFDCWVDHGEIPEHVRKVIPCRELNRR